MKSLYKKNNSYYLRLLALGFYLLFCIQNRGYAEIANPDGPQVIANYAALENVVTSSDPKKARPIALGNIARGGATLNIKVELDTLKQNSDIYLGISAPAIAPGKILLVTEEGELANYDSELIPWKRNVKQVNADVFGDILHTTLPGGNYTFYLLVSPEGKKPFNNFYLWNTTLTLKPTLEETANKVLTQFGNDNIDGVLAVVRAIDNGYSSLQLQSAILSSSLQANGTILDKNRELLVAENQPTLLIRDEPQPMNARARFGDSDTMTPETAGIVFFALAQLLNQNQSEPESGLLIMLKAILDAHEQELDPEDLIEAIFWGFVRAKGSRIDFTNGPADDPNSQVLQGTDCTASVQRNSKARNLPVCHYRSVAIPEFLENNQFNDVRISFFNIDTDRGIFDSFHTGTSGSIAKDSALGKLNFTTLINTSDNGFDRTGTLNIELSDDGMKIEDIRYSWSFFLAERMDPGKSVSRKVEFTGHTPPGINVRYLPNRFSGDIQYAATGEDACDFIKIYLQMDYTNTNTDNVLSSTIEPIASCSEFSELRISFFAPPK